jgi:hypothetical protein
MNKVSKTPTKTTKAVVTKKVNKGTSVAKPVIKKAMAKVAKAEVKKTGPVNKELEKMIATMNAAKKAGEKSVVVFTTSVSNHKKTANRNGFGVSDLKPKLYEAYKYFLCKHDVTARLVDNSEMAVEWIVKLK